MYTDWTLEAKLLTDKMHNSTNVSVGFISFIVVSTKREVSFVPTWPKVRQELVAITFMAHDEEHSAYRASIAKTCMNVAFVKRSDGWQYVLGI